MAHHSVIALVTATLHDLIGEAIRDRVAGGTVRLGPPPSVASDGLQASLYLHRLSLLPQMQNDELPARQADGNLVRPPRTAVELHYLLSFDGQDTLAAHVMLGAVLSATQTVPVLTAERMEAMLRGDGPFSALHGVPRPDPWLPVRLTPEYPTASEQWDLWRAFGAVPRPSLHYLASPILIDAEGVAAAATPVSAVGIGI